MAAVELPEKSRPCFDSDTDIFGIETIGIYYIVFFSLLLRFFLIILFFSKLLMLFKNIFLMLMLKTSRMIAITKIGWRI